jgi:hypothetical protein
MRITPSPGCQQPGTVSTLVSRFYGFNLFPVLENHQSGNASDPLVLRHLGALIDIHDKIRGFPRPNPLRDGRLTQLFGMAPYHSA